MCAGHTNRPPGSSSQPVPCAGNIVLYSKQSVGIVKSVAGFTALSFLETAEPVGKRKGQNARLTIEMAMLVKFRAHGFKREHSGIEYITEIQADGALLIEYVAAQTDIQRKHRVDPALRNYPGAMVIAHKLHVEQAGDPEIAQHAQCPAVI